MLYKLLSSMDRKKFVNSVVCLTPPGLIGRRIQEIGIQVDHLGLRLGRPDPKAVYKLIKLLRQIKPDIIQTWMYHADLIGLIAAKWIQSIKIVWNIRNSCHDFSQFKKLTVVTLKACARLSRFTDAIIANSICGRESHIHHGYCSSHFKVITNGFDVTRFKPNRLYRDNLRTKLGLPDEYMLVGMFARFDKAKDHRNLLLSARRLIDKRLNVRFVLCGDQITSANTQLMDWINKLKIASFIYLLGRRDDTPELMAAMDLVVLSSVSEGFPNVVGEAMACEVPCVVTDVGDAALLVGDTGKIVPPGKPDALADALCDMLEISNEHRTRLGKRARMKIKFQYSIEKIVHDYQDLYTNLLTS